MKSLLELMAKNKNPFDKLILFSSFQSKGSVLGEELFQGYIYQYYAKKITIYQLHQLLFQTTDEISKEFLFGNFEYHQCVEESRNQIWDKEYYKKHIDPGAQQIFIVGPRENTQKIKADLKSIGFVDNVVSSLS